MEENKTNSKNMIYSEYDLYMTSIFDLRNIARSLGIISPTTLKKEDLISKIIKIQNGEETPQMPKSRQGRPPKKQVEIVPFADNYSKKYFTEENALVVKPREILPFNEKYDIDTYQNGVTLFKSSEDRTESMSLLYKIGNDFVIKKNRGILSILDTTEGGFVFMFGKSASVESAVYIDKFDIVEYCLHNGDLIEFEYKETSLDDGRFLSKILKVNGMDIADYLKYCEENNFDDKEVRIEKDDINSINDYICGSKNVKNVHVGTKNVFFVPKTRDCCDIVCGYLYKQQDDIYYLNLNLEIASEDIPQLVVEGAENFYSCYCDNLKQHMFALDIVYKRFRRLIELGKKVVLVFNELGKTIKFENFYNDRDALDIRKDSLDFCYKILALAGVYKNGSQATIISSYVASKKERNFDFVKNELENMHCDLYEL